MRKNDALFVVCGHILKLEEEDDNRIAQELMRNCTGRIVHSWRFLSGCIVVYRIHLKK